MQGNGVPSDARLIPSDSRLFGPASDSWPIPEDSRLYRDTSGFDAAKPEDSRLVAAGVDARLSRQASDSRLAQPYELVGGARVPYEGNPTDFA